MSKSKKTSVLKRNVKIINNYHKVQRKLAARPPSLRNFYDATYDDNMAPVGCYIINKNTKKSICFLRYDLADSSMYAYPVIKHYSDTNCSDSSKWGTEWYSSDPTANGDWVSTYDHTVDVFLGLIFFDELSDAIDFAKEAWGYLSQADGNGDLVITNRVYPNILAMYEGDSANYNSAEVCGTNSVSGKTRSCFLWIFDIYGPNYYITGTGYQLFAGACRNSVHVQTAFTKSSKHSPEPLIQTYYKCVLDPYDSAFNAIGLSLGNADLYSRWFFFLLMGCVVFYLTQFHGFETHMDEFVTKEEEEAADDRIQGVEMKRLANDEQDGPDRMQGVGPAS